MTTQIEIAGLSSDGSRHQCCECFQDIEQGEQVSRNRYRVLQHARCAKDQPTGSVTAQAREFAAKMSNARDAIAVGGDLGDQVLSVLESEGHVAPRSTEANGAAPVQTDNGTDLGDQVVAILEAR